jgi:hypothetical protein
MIFPENEITRLQIRLDKKSPIYTTRVSKEQGKYDIGNLVKTNISKTLLIVREITTITNINEHPFLNELSLPQKEEIVSYDPPYDVIKLERVI